MCPSRLFYAPHVQGAALPLIFDISCLLNSWFSTFLYTVFRRIMVKLLLFRPLGFLARLLLLWQESDQRG